MVLIHEAVNQQKRYTQFKIRQKNRKDEQNQLVRFILIQPY